MKICVLCKEKFAEFGNNPEPLAPFKDGKCYDMCNMTKVIPARLNYAYKRSDNAHDNGG